MNEVLKRINALLKQLYLQKNKNGNILNKININNFH